MRPEAKSNHRAEAATGDRVSTHCGWGMPEDASLAVLKLAVDLRRHSWYTLSANDAREANGAFVFSVPLVDP